MSNLLKFCESQLCAKGNRENACLCNPEDQEAELFCGAHLHEGRAFPCPYTPDDIYTSEGRMRIAHKKGGDLIGHCEDFETSKNYLNSLEQKTTNAQS